MPKVKLGRVTIARRRRTHMTDCDRWEVRVNGHAVADVSPLLDHRVFPPEPTGEWYFVARDDELGIRFRNTWGERGRSEEEVKQAAVEYVKNCLAERASQQRQSADNERN